MLQTVLLSQRLVAAMFTPSPVPGVVPIIISGHGSLPLSLLLPLFLLLPMVWGWEGHEVPGSVLHHLTRGVRARGRSPVHVRGDLAQGVEVEETLNPVDLQVEGPGELCWAWQDRAGQVAILLPSFRYGLGQGQGGEFLQTVLQGHLEDSELTEGVIAILLGLYMDN